MQLRIFAIGINSEGGISMEGRTLTNELLLNKVAEEPMHAVNKLYVDSLFDSIATTDIKSGTIPNSVIPEFTGDVINTQGSDIIELPLSSVVEDTYTKVTVNSKGFIVSADNITNTDIPNLDWSKITENKPTTIDEYGITDAVSLSNPVVDELVLYGNPTDVIDLVTKEYADNSVLGLSGDGLVTGDIMGYPITDTPTGYIRANGALLSKTTYANLYAIIGDTFSSTTNLGSGRPWSLQYDINETQSGDLTTWTTGTILTEAIQESVVLVTNSRVYLLGGFNGSVTIATGRSAPINSDGTLGAWTTSKDLDVPLFSSNTIVTKNKLVILGGQNSTGNVDTVRYSSINTDGTLPNDGWLTSPSLPAGLRRGHVVITRNNRMFYIGGTDSSNPSSAVYTTTFDSNGVPGIWDIASPLPVGIWGGAIAVIRDRVYLLGGVDSVGDVNTVYYSNINPDGTIGTWNTDTPLPVAMSSHSVIVTKNTIYLVGGLNSSSVYYASINIDGTLGTWTTGTSLPNTLWASHPIVTSSKLYLLGGRIGTTTDVVHVTDFTGGFNDYSPYYDGSTILVDPNSFAVPDFSNSETLSLFYYIKL